MPFDELIETLKRQFEVETGWGDSNSWTNQDFITLSERIHERTGVTLSHVTLKRIWGKVKYDSLPNTYTLDTLARYLGFSGWRTFTATHQQASAANGAASSASPVENPPLPVVAANIAPARKRWVVALSILTLAAVVIATLSIHRSLAPVHDGDYSFSSKKVVSTGVPNSVVFDFDARKAPGDSVVIQQSWDKKLRQKVSKYDRQHTSIYYLPDYYRAKLVVNNRIVKEHDLLIKSNGWVSAVLLDPVPVYFDSSEVIRGGFMSVSPGAIAKRNIAMQPNTPWTLYSYVQDLGEIYSDDMVFETRVKSDYREGTAICQKANIYILCQGTAIMIPLCAKGCVSDANLIFTNYTTSGKKEDLSAFGTDLSRFVKLKIVVHNHKGEVFVDDKLIYTINRDIIRKQVIGFDLSFQGTGSVDYVKLTNGRVTYNDDF